MALQGRPAAEIGAAGAISWAAITAKPTTLAGFGITDAYTRTEADARYAPIGGAGATGLWGISVMGSAATVTGAAQPNITSVGTLTSLAVTGAITQGGVAVSLAGHTHAASNITSGTFGAGAYTFPGALAVAGAVALRQIDRIGPLSNNPERGVWNPIWSALGAGFSLYPDEEFSTGSNGVGVYNNAGGSGVVHLREAGDGSQPNRSGWVIKITNNGAATSPGWGGLQLNIPSRRNATFVQRFRAKLPTGYTLELAENPQGDNATSYWLTSQAGTGKWEEYIRVSHCGNTGTFANGGHIYVTGSTSIFTWFLASATVVEIDTPNNQFASLAVTGALTQGGVAVSLAGHTHAASALTGTTLAASVVTSSLTSLGTLTSLAVSGVATLSSHIQYAVANGADFDIKPVNQFGFGLRLRPHGSAGGVANRSFQIGSWDNANNYAALVTVIEGGAVTCAASLAITGALTGVTTIVASSTATASDFVLA